MIFTLLVAPEYEGGWVSLTEDGRLYTRADWYPVHDEGNWLRGSLYEVKASHNAKLENILEGFSPASVGEWVDDDHFVISSHDGGEFGIFKFLNIGGVQMVRVQMSDNLADSRYYCSPSKENIQRYFEVFQKL